MKVLGRGARTIIFEASEDEVGNLLGHYYEPGIVAKLGPGNIIKVSEMFEQLRQLKSHRDTLESTAKELEAYANILRLKDPIIKEVINVDQKEST